MTESNFHPPLVQIAFSVLDLHLTERWFREGLGFLPAGGNAEFMSSPVAEQVQGLPGAASTCWWLVDRNPWFQLELFKFRQPMAKPMSVGFRPCDTGYTRIGVHVSDFDAVLASLQVLGTRPLTPSLGGSGQRRACVRNPDGVFVEIMEADPLAGNGKDQRACPVATRSVTMSTPDLAASVAYLTAVTGQLPTDIDLHLDEHEALWGLAGANCKRAVFECGDILLEVVQYLDPVGKPWPTGYRICDQGVLNIAFGARSQADHMQVYERASQFGARPNCAPLHIPDAGVVYINDSLGFSVETLWLTPGGADKEWGFEPMPLAQRPEPDDSGFR